MWLFFILQILYHMSLGDSELKSFFNYPLLTAYLVPSLMRFYVNVESTGASSQFYDKFNIRYHISEVFKEIWQIPAHRQQMKAESENFDEFVRFVNLLLNDTTYLLDESLSKLAQIHNIQESPTAEARTRRAASANMLMSVSFGGVE